MDMADPFFEWLNKTFPRNNEINKRTSIPAKMLKENKKQQPMMVDSVTQNESILQKISPISEEPNMVETIEILPSPNNVTVTQRTFQGPLNYTEDNQETEPTCVTVQKPGTNNVDDQDDKQLTGLSPCIIIGCIAVPLLITFVIIITIFKCVHYYKARQNRSPSTPLPNNKEWPALSVIDRHDIKFIRIAKNDIARVPHIRQLLKGNNRSNKEPTHKHSLKRK